VSVRVINGDCLEVLKTLADNSVDAVVTDPPYHLTSMVKRLSSTSSGDVEKNFTKIIPGQKTNPHAAMARGFMGKSWDGGYIAQNPALWSEVLRVLKPGGHVAAFGGTRTYHRMACAIEDAGFGVRDQLAWVYGQGFPKSHDVSKAIDKAAGAEREVIGINEDYLRRKPNGMKTDGANTYGYSQTQHETDARITAPATDAARQWEGWGSNLKPSWEPICLARKPLSEKTVAANVLRWGTGAINVGACKIEGGERPARSRAIGNTTEGRFPANLCHDGSDEVLDLFPETAKSTGRDSRGRVHQAFTDDARKSLRDDVHEGFGDSGSAARYFYCAKASKNDRAGSKHPTVKPVKLMQWLCRLITPPGGVILDPFAGSGTTGAAAILEGFGCILIEREAEYIADILRRIGSVADAPLFSQAAE
jgi:DNA modification methylase